MNKNIINVIRYFIIFKNIDKMLKKCLKIVFFVVLFWNERTENNFSLIYSLNVNFSEFFRSFQKIFVQFKVIRLVMTQVMSHSMSNIY